MSTENGWSCVKLQRACNSKIFDSRLTDGFYLCTVGYFIMSKNSKNRHLSGWSCSFGHEKHVKTRKTQIFGNLGLPQSQKLKLRPQLVEKFAKRIILWDFSAQETFFHTVHDVYQKKLVILKKNSWKKLCQNRFYDRFSKKKIEIFFFQKLFIWR